MRESRLYQGFEGVREKYFEMFWLDFFDGFFGVNGMFFLAAFLTIF